MHSGKFNWTYVLGSAMMDPLYRGKTVIVYEGIDHGLDRRRRCRVYVPEDLARQDRGVSVHGMQQGIVEVDGVGRSPAEAWLKPLREGDVRAVGIDRPRRAIYGG